MTATITDLFCGAGGSSIRGLTKKDRVKLAGNAVTPPVPEWILGRVVHAMEAA